MKKQQVSFPVLNMKFISTWRPWKHERHQAIKQTISRVLRACEKHQLNKLHWFSPCIKSIKESVTLSNKWQGFTSQQPMIEMYCKLWTFLWLLFVICVNPKWIYKLNLRKGKLKRNYRDTNRGGRGKGRTSNFIWIA